MAKSIKRKKLDWSGDQHPADKEMANMRYIDLKIACIEMGMPFEEVSNGDHSTLSSFFKTHYGTRRNKQLLINFETWLAQLMIDRGYDPDDPLVTFKLSNATDEELASPPKSATKSKRIQTKQKNTSTTPKAASRPKKRERKNGVITGTKKSLTFELALQGLEINEIITKVMEQFPDASDKSIKIWVRKAKRMASS